MRLIRRIIEALKPYRRICSLCEGSGVNPWDGNCPICSGKGTL